jgi:enamine deaminase RidA (YjgF/YER057c/UK114 family)
MSSAVLNIIREGSGPIGCSESVVFDHVLYTAGNIVYNPATGEITLPEAGRFMVQWWVSLQSAISKAGAVLALSTSQGDLFYGNSPDKTGRDLWDWVS